MVASAEQSYSTALDDISSTLETIKQLVIKSHRYVLPNGKSVSEKIAPPDETFSCRRLAGTLDCSRSVGGVNDNSVNSDHIPAKQSHPASNSCFELANTSPQCPDASADQYQGL